MKKVAVFVEGQTEQIFVSLLLEQIFTVNELYVEIHKLQGMFRPIKVNAQDLNTEIKYFFVICDCGNNERVKTDILDNYTYLKRQQFSLVIGLRDAFSPKNKNILDIDKFRRMLNSGLPEDIPIRIFLAVQEIEAWFIAEENHYQHISSDLKLELINAIAGIDISVESTESIRHPTVTLNNIYQQVGKKYSKAKYVIQNLVYSLDFTNLYLNVRNRNNSLNELLTCLDGLIP
jgi:hypothetical protein